VVKKLKETPGVLASEIKSDRRLGYLRLQQLCLPDVARGGLTACECSVPTDIFCFMSS
jgi:hypothetical protein